MKNIKILVISLVSLSLLGACSKSYLDTKPTNSANPEIIFATTANVEAAINGICKLMTIQYLGTQGFNGEGTIKMYYGNYPGNDFFVNLPGWSNLINSNYNENTSSSYCYYPWYYYYNLVGNANKVICNVEQAEGDIKDIKYLKAQALTFRAYAFTMLAQLYGNRWSDSNDGATGAIVLRLDESTGSMPVSTLAQTYKQIYDDLDLAIKLYTESGRKRAPKEFFRPDINVAYATYARAAITRQDYATAATMAANAHKGYPLMDNKAYVDGFSNPTSEWIWGSYGASDETLFFYSYHAYIAYNSSASAVRTYPKCISKELFNQIPATDIRKGLFLDPKSFKYDAATGKADKDGKLEAAARTLFPDIYSTSTIYAYMQFKVKNNDQPGIGNLNHFRSSEMYLIEAEAKFFQNDEPGAIAALVALNKTSGRDPQYTCNKTGAELLKEIKKYRRLELWGEGFDWFDMKRWGDAIDRNDHTGGGNFITDLAVKIQPDAKNKWTWKIPLKESDYNDAI